VRLPIFGHGVVPPVGRSREVLDATSLWKEVATQHELEHAGLHRKAIAHPEASVFADLSGYTTLTEELGDHAAADMALRLAELMQEVAEHHGGRVVKMLGDGVFFLFDEPPRAVLGSLDFVDGAPTRGLPPAHVGVNAGPVTYTDGDYTDCQ
jgi:adenylate cyclase